MNNDEKNYDRFNDIKTEEGGIFADGTRVHDRVGAHVTSEGLALEFACNGCGVPIKLVVEFPELVALRYGLNPAQIFHGRTNICQEPMPWTFETEENVWKPHAKCTRCGFNFVVRLTPDEPDRYLSQGRRARYINPAGEKIVSDLCAQAAGQLAARAQQRR